MKEFQLCGLGNAVVDIFLEVSDSEFASLGFERGGMQQPQHDRDRAQGGGQSDVVERLPCPVHEGGH